MAINDLYMVDFQQKWGTGGEIMHMNFFYRAKDADGTAQALHAAMGGGDGIIGQINEIQSTWVKNFNLKVINLFSLTDFFEQGINGTGEVAQPALPAQDTMSFTLKLNTRGVKPGRKSVSGIPAIWNDHGIITNTDGIGAVNLLASMLAEDIEDTGTGAVFEPVVVKRVQTPVAATEERPAYTKYNLPTEAEDASWGKVVSVLVNNHFGSMDTRDNGR
jgi:hypothetical protein